MRGARSISEQGRELEREGQERKVQEEEEEQEPRLTKMRGGGEGGRQLGLGASGPRSRRPPNRS